MAFCINCGQELTEGAKFCSVCGQAVHLKSESRQREVVYDGTLHKCPNCGEALGAYETVCKACGHEIRGRKVTSAVHELSIKLEMVNNEARRNELIRTFYIPNTKEDIHEFFILATSNIKAGGASVNAWLAKMEQAYQKAELSFAETSEFERIRVLYEQTQMTGKKRRARNVVRKVFSLFVAGVGMLFFLEGADCGDILLVLLGVFLLIAPWIPSIVSAKAKKKSISEGGG